MSKLVLIINGVATAGKDTFVDFLDEKTQRVIRLSTVDRVKEICQLMGCDSTVKDDKNRKFISDLKDLWTEYNDGVFELLTDQTDGYLFGSEEDEEVIVTIMCREPGEIQKFVDYYGSDVCKTVLVDRPMDHVPDNTGDRGVYNYVYDYKIDNGKDLKHLKQQAMLFLDNLLLTA